MSELEPRSLNDESPEGLGAQKEEERPRRRLFLHLALFLATGVTTMAAGAFQAGANLFVKPWLIYKGLPFSASVLLILTAHEMGHYLMSRRHRLDVSLPYFLPGLPFPPPLPGTFGALIRIRSPILDKRALIDVGCSGPLLGVLATLPVLVVGLKLSRVVTIPEAVADAFTLQLGEPLLFRLVCWLVLGPQGPLEHVLLHPVAFAGWLGLLITALNLLPVGQLDGGTSSMPCCRTGTAGFPLLASCFSRSLGWSPGKAG